MHEWGKYTDAALAEAAQKHESAFEEILKRYERLIYHITRRYFKSPEDAMDASQEAAIKIYSGLSRVVLPEGGTLKAWICTVTARVCLDALRKRRVQTTELTDEFAPKETAPSAEENAAASERAREILAAIHSLPNDHRIIIILRDMQGLSYDELAAALKLSPGTVKSRLARARRALRKII